jgi:hypothetical protein
MHSSRISSLVASIALSACLLVPASPRAIGLYTDYISYFSPIDTARTSLLFRQTELQRDEGRAAVLSAELLFRNRGRMLFRLQLPFPTVPTDGDFLYDIGDGGVRAEVRIFGDTLDTSGLFLIGDARLPMGKKEFQPISYGSLDGGGGLELRGKTTFFQLRLASTFTLVGDRVKTGPFIHDNYTTVAMSIETELVGGASLSFSGFGLLFRGGGKREIYVLSVRQALSRGIEAFVSGALEAGTDEERVFNSQVALAIRYSFPSPPAGEK